ncbi:OLC1v1037701C1 [Oldenlandia corymbosa var. corymbosa]|uniref:OLC1v1037701C1 n=1 Tax=Oldenlandia corymbosa var. corymbosa TaxID=529605 RepID=A0AAV1CY71_OLDCO|nr:OLC1v1037701C1 [Oldenlandia corymbosa var. corymbosa]
MREMDLTCYSSDASAPADPGHCPFPGLRNPPDSGRRLDVGKKHKVVKSKSGRTTKLPDDRSTKSRYRTCDPPNYDRQLRQYCLCIEGAVFLDRENIPYELLQGRICKDWGDCSAAPEDEKGPPSLAFIFGEKEVMVAVNHSETGSPPNFIKLHDHLVATITEENVDVLKDIEQRVLQWEHLNGRKIYAEKAAQLMADIMFSRDLVGLVALVAGIDSIKDWSVWCVDEAAWWARRALCLVAACADDGDAFVTGPEGVKNVIPDVYVEAFARRSGFCLGKRIMVGRKKTWRR